MDSGAGTPQLVSAAVHTGGPEFVSQHHVDAKHMLLIPALAVQKQDHLGLWASLPELVSSRISETRLHRTRKG